MDGTGAATADGRRIASSNGMIFSSRAWREHFEALDTPVPARACEPAASAFRRASEIGGNRLG